MFFAVSFFLLLPLLCVVNAATPGYNCNIISGKLRQIDAGSGKVYGVNSNDDIFHWLGNEWKRIDGKLTHVTVGTAGVWGVNRANQIYKLQNNAWVSVTGSLKQMDAGGDNIVVGVNVLDNVFCSRQQSADTPVSWNLVGGSLKYYSCGLGGCFGVSNFNNIYFRRGVTANACQGTGWQQINGSLVMIEAATDGAVYGVNSAGTAYRRDGISANTPTGTSWTQLDLGYDFKHVTYDDGYLWLITVTDDILQCAVTN